VIDSIGLPVKNLDQNLPKHYWNW